MGSKDDKKSGTEAFHEMGAKLKADQQAKKEQEEKGMTEVKNQLAALKDNSELAKMYSESAKVGADNLSGELPLLKVHQVGKSTKNELSDGSEPNDGWFFYKPTGEQFKEIECHVLTISKGFRAEGLNDGKEVFNQILAGVIIGENKEFKPFMFYFTGLKLQHLWDFGKEAAKFTRMKPISIPMFALRVKLTTERVQNNYGRSWIINFEIMKNEDNSPVLIMDPGEFQYLKDNVEMVEDTIASLIEAKAVKDDDEGLVTAAKQVFTPRPEAEPTQEENTEPVNPDDVPF